MKILYVTTVSVTMGFFPEHIRMLQNAGHTVELACNMDEPPAEKVTALGCRAYHVPFSRSPLSRNNLAAYRELKSIVEKGNYDIVHTHTPIASALVRIACRKLRKKGLKVFYTAHGFHFCKGAPLLNWLIYYPVEKLCSRWTDVQITITKEDYQRAKKKLHAKKTVYIPGVGVDLNKFTPGDKWISGSRRAELGIPEDAKMLLSVGELNGNKNHATVLAALNEMKDESIYYVVCGEGDKRAELQQKIKDYGLENRVWLLGVRNDVSQWMADADIYVHPSFREGLSVSTMEAMMSGLPVICGNIRGNCDLIHAGRGGILCNPADADEFAKAIRTLLDDEEKCAAMGEYNKSAVKEFSLERVLDGLKDVYGMNSAKELLFVYDDRVAIDEKGDFYTGSTFSQSVFDRYLRHFDHICLLARSVDKGADSKRVNLVDSSKVTVRFMQNLKGSMRDYLSPARRRAYKKSICDEITDDRAVIVRVPSDSGAVAASYCRKTGKPYLAEVVGCPWDSYRNHSAKGKLLAPFEFLRQRRAVRGADYALYVTSEFLQRRYPTKGKAAGISDVELLPADESVLEKRLEKIKNHTGRLLVGTAAAVDVAYKGQRYVIEALAKLKAQGNDGFEYHLAGGGDSAALKSLAEELGVSDRVVFDGRLPHDEMFAWLDRMDIYIQPSLQEGLPRSVVEAMSRGLPAFTSRTGGMPELVGDDVIFANKNVNEIAEYLAGVDRMKLMTMAEKNFNKAKEFEKDLLTEKRNKFFAEFASAAGESRI